MTSISNPIPDNPALLLHAYIDGELNAVDALKVEQHLETDPALRAERDRIVALRHVMAERLPREELPPGLRQRVENAVGMRRPSPRPTWLSLAASIVVTAAIASSSSWFVSQYAQDHDREQAIFSNHLRSLMAPQAVDVASSEQHTVKPWFNGRVAEAPRVIDLAGAGFPLAGGRVDVVKREPASTLVYRRRQHTISLTAVRIGTNKTTPFTESTDRGFNVVTWQQDGVEYWTVSDLNMAELREFARLFQAGS